MKGYEITEEELFVGDTVYKMTSEQLIDTCYGRCREIIEMGPRQERGDRRWRVDIVHDNGCVWEYDIPKNRCFGDVFEVGGRYRIIRVEVAYEIFTATILRIKRL
jgi:hypothetical protein